MSENIAVELPKTKVHVTCSYCDGYEDERVDSGQLHHDLMVKMDGQATFVCSGCVKKTFDTVLKKKPKK